MTAPRVLVTGAAGAVGRALREGLRGEFPLLRLTDIRSLSPALAGEETTLADLSDAHAVAPLVAGIDCIVHLAAIPGEAGWDDILRHNVAATANVFEAARAAGVKRVVFASSNHAVGFHRVERMLDTTAEPRPDSRYGVSKVFGEAVGRLYADKYGLSVACVRIGTFAERPGEARHLATWMSPRDLVALVRCLVAAPDFHYLLVYGVSANTRARWQNPALDWLGFRPRDNAEAWAAEIQSIAPPATDPAARFHGGPLCAVEFAGDPARID